MVPSQCYLRTLRIDTPRGHGSAFTVTQHDRQWLVTARHVIDGFGSQELALVNKNGQVDVELQALPHVNSAADIAVFALSKPITPELPMHPTSKGAIFTQDAYFLGFPYGLGNVAGDITYPLVKKAIFSGAQPGKNGTHLWFLDGINNPGFSGGPVVFNKSGTKDWHVAAVVSGYLPERIDVVEGEGVVPVNTGIVLAYDIAAAVDAIDGSA